MEMLVGNGLLFLSHNSSNNYLQRAKDISDKFKD